MRRSLIIIVGIIGVLGLLYLSVTAAWRYIEYLDQPIVQASGLRPLEGADVYKIVLTSDSDGVYYGIIRPEEPNSAASLAWRKIGYTPVDLADYLNKPVRIMGTYYMGVPLQDPQDHQGGSDLGVQTPEVVIQIDHIEEVR